MRRVAIIGVTFVSVLASVVVFTAVTEGSRAIALGRRSDNRSRLAGASQRKSAGRPAIAWLGDSTIMGQKGLPSYPQLIHGADRRVGAAEHVIVAGAGFDSYHYYFLLGGVLDQHPDLVVLIANLRLFGPQGRFSRPCVDFVSMLPASELPRAIQLPLHERGITIPRLLLDRALRYPAVDDGTYFLGSLRDEFRYSSSWGLLGPATDKWNQVQVVRYIGYAEDMLAHSFDTPLSPRQPVVRMMEATIEMATRRATRTLVIVTPIPYQFLRSLGAYDEDRYGKRVDLLRRVTEQAGGAFLDLHRELDESEFRDHSGHFTPAGAQHLVRVVEPIVRGALAHEWASAQLRPPARSSGPTAGAR